MLRCWRFPPARGRPAVSTMSAPCSSSRTAGSTIGMRRRSAASRNTACRSRADGDRAQGIRLQALRQAAARQAARFIPWNRVSSAYGFSQALDGTWAQYRREIGNFTARPHRFFRRGGFCRLYHGKTIDTFGVARDDTFNLYLAYYFGWGGYKRGEWRTNAGAYSVMRATPTRWPATTRRSYGRCDGG